MALTDFDLFLLGTGAARKAYEHLGAHLQTRNRVKGVRFAVWAPNAEAVSVLGDWNHWSAGADALACIGDSGIWEGFIPRLRAGTTYKYAIRPRGSEHWLEKADPYAFAAEMRPATASVVADLSAYRWTDRSWLTRRRKTDWTAAPIAIYEVHLGSWRRDPSEPGRFLSYRELAETLPQYVREMGYTHIELLPVTEHPLDMSWGYQVTGYFAPSARFGTPADFMYFVDRCHQEGIGVIVDWVPAHFPKDAHALAQFDGTHLYEHADPRQGEHPDWGTLIFNYGRSEVRSFLMSSAVFWLDRYHVDGLRVDAVASMLYLDYSRGPDQWLPNKYGGRENLEAIELLRAANAAVHEEAPGALTFAEESTAWPKVTGAVEEGGLGFDFKWNMGWMHDTLRYMEYDPIHRRFHQNDLTFSMMYAFSERYVLPLSHDEVVHLKRSLLSKMPGDDWQKFANLRLLYGYMYSHPGKKLLFMGGEFGQWHEWAFDQSLDWHLLDSESHRGLQACVRDLNALYVSRPALHQLEHDWSGFEWIDFSDAENSVIAFQRKSAGAKDRLIVICNFTPVVRHGYRIGLPGPGEYHEVLNTDAAGYGGSGIANGTPIRAEESPWHGQPYSAEVTLPPLALFVLDAG